VHVTVYERAPVITEVGAGMMLWPNATRILRELALLDSVVDCSGRNTHFVVRASSGKMLMNIALGDFDVPALCVRRCDLLNVLLTALPAERIALDHRFESLSRSKGSVTLRFTNGHIAEHDAVVGADGLRSLVRAQLFGISEPVYRGYTIWRGIAPYNRSSSASCNSESWGKGQRFGILHTGHGRVTWYATANCDAGVPDATEGRRSQLLRMFENWHEPVEDIIDATPEPSILKHGAYDLDPLRKWGVGRVTLLGDAAHACTPNLGQGGCMAIEDALALAQSVQHETCLDTAFRRYEKLRRPRTAHIQQRCLLMGRIGQWENRLVVDGRRIVTGLLPAGLFEFNLRRVYSYRT